MFSQVLIKGIMKNKKGPEILLNLKEMSKKWDRNFIYLGLVIILILLIMVVHSSYIPNTKYSFGFCDYKIFCKGISVGNVCIGGKSRTVSCVNPEKINNTREYAYRMTELRCALQANSLCKNNSITGFEWVQKSSYKNKTCAEWKQEYPEIKLLNCNQTFADVTQYQFLE